MTRPALLLLASWLVFFGCGKKVDSAFFVLKEKAMNDLKAKTASHEAAWGMGKGDRWDFNQDDGKLVFTFPDKTVTCDAQIIGSFNKAKGTWLWSWDNPSVDTNLTRHSEWLRNYGAQNKHDQLTRSKWKATEEDAWEMTALATLLCNAQGAYRGPAGDLYIFMTFGPPSIQRK